MSGIEYIPINVTLELTCLVITAAFLLALIFTNDKETRLSRILIVMLANHCGLLLADAFAWIFATRTEPYIYPLLRVANFFVYGLGYLTPVLISFYLITYISSSYPLMPYKKGILTGAIVSVCIMETLLIISQFTGWIYYIDPVDNYYHLGPLALFSHSYSLLFMIVIMMIILHCRNHMSKRDLSVMSMFVIIPIIGVMLEALLNDSIMFLNLTTTIAYIMLYVSIQVRHEVQASETETSLRTAIMLSQIQPHFLYNTLGTIGDLYVTDPEQAQETVFEFSDYLRMNMDSLSSPNLVPFEKELTHVKTYLFLEKKRFGDRLDIEYDIRTDNFSIPQLTVQPMVENAVLHGVTRRTEGGKVTLRTEEVGGEIKISIIDDGVGFDLNAPYSEGKSHVGIDNVRKRLAVICSGKLTIESEPGKGTTTTIQIPNGEAVQL